MNQYFSFNRFSNLYRLWWFRNHKTSLLYLGVFAGISILLTIWFTWVATNEFRNFGLWKPMNYIPAHVFVFIALGIFYSGAAFPGFRSKEKTFEYLLVPSTTFEKFLFEWINRVVVYVVFFPLIFSLLVNTTTASLALYYTDFTGTRGDIFWIFTKLEPSEITLLVLGAFAILNIPFMGASHFQMKPLMKTLFFFFLCLAAYILYTYGLVKIFDLENRTPEDDCIFFICSKEEAFTFFIGLGILVNLFLMSISYLKLKEKEV